MRKGFKMISFQVDPTKYHLTSKETRLLIEKGADLFAYMKNTVDSKKYLDDNKDLQEILEKW